MRRPIFSLAIGLAVVLLIPSAAARIWQKGYDGFTVWLDCTNHGGIAFHYELSTDTGNEQRSGSFPIDDTVPAACQPISGDSYRTPAVPVAAVGTYDRGHLVPANHMDHSEHSMADTFFVTNVLPQATAFNQEGGAWFRTEIISECYRDITPLKIWGGVIFDGSHADDFFLASHGVFTPDWWWKLIYRADTDTYVAWIFPNSREATDADMDLFIVDIPTLKAQLEYVPDFGDAEEATASTTTWDVLKSGNQLTCEGITTGLG